MLSSNLEPLEFLNVVGRMGTTTRRERKGEREERGTFISAEIYLILERGVFSMRVTSDGRRDLTDWNIRSKGTDRVP